MNIDEYDQAILALVAQNTLLTHQEIGDRVNLSASAVRRRLARLNETGVIQANVAITNPGKIGLTFIVRLQLSDDHPGVAESVEKALLSEPCVSQVYAIAGDYDYIVIVHAVSPEAYYAWSERVFVVAPEVKRYESALVWQRKKFSMHVEAVAEGSAPVPPTA